MGASVQKQSRSYNRRKQTAFFSDINVTPLVDVMLVLLVVFMVTAPMMTIGIPVDLPHADGAPREDKKEPIMISLDSSGKIFLQETEMDVPVLIQKLIVLTQENKDQKIYVRGDKNINYGKVIEIMSAISAAGFDKVSLMAELATKEDLLKAHTIQQSAPAPQNTPGSQSKEKVS